MKKTFGLFTYYHALFTYQGESDSFWSSPKLPSDFWEHQKIKNLNFKFSIISTFFIRSSNFDGFLMRSADVALIDGTQRQKTPSQSKMSIKILIFLKHFSCFFVSVKRFCRWRELRRLSKTLDFEEKCINHAFL